MSALPNYLAFVPIEMVGSVTLRQSAVRIPSETIHPHCPRRLGPAWPGATASCAAAQGARTA